MTKDRTGELLEQVVRESQDFAAKPAGLGDAFDKAVAALRSVLGKHTEFKLYEECDHRHTDEDVQQGKAIDVAEVGYVCFEGYQRSICRECCTGGSGYQSEECADNHGICWPCSTVDAIAAALRGDHDA